MNIAECREFFPSVTTPLLGGRLPIYLDGPGGSQVPASVMTAITGYYLSSNANTHGAFWTSRLTDRTISDARLAAADFLGASSPDTISFGQNMTTLNFLLSEAIAATLKPGDEIVVTELDHEANVAPWLRLEDRGIRVRQIPMRDDGRLDPDAWAHTLSSRTKLVALGWASNALGTVNPVAEIRQFTRQVGAWLLIDAVHWAPHGPIDVKALEPDFLLCSAYKFFGPHVGILYSAPGRLEALPTLRVRTQNPHPPYRMETGTLNHAALAGVTAAINFIAACGHTGETRRERLKDAMHRIYAYEHRLAADLYEGLQRIPGIQVYGPPVDDKPRTPTLSFTVDGRHSAEVARLLAAEDIYVWDGDFYALGVLTHYGLQDRGGLVRIGLAPYNIAEDITRTVEVLASIASVKGSKRP